MAQLSDVDFQSYIAQKKAQPVGGPTGFDYCYVSDRTTRATFEKIAPVEYATSAVVRAWKEWGRNELLGQTVRVTENQFPRIHGLNVKAAQALGIPTPTLYLGQNPNLNAATFGTNEDAFILMNGSVIDHFTDPEILDILGHECGHIQNNHVVYMTSLFFLTHMANVFIQWFAYPARVALLAWSRRAEITCDRAGLLVVKDLQVSMKGLMKLAIGSQKLYDELNVDEYLKQYEDGKRGAGRLSEIFASHPYVPKRVKALKVFAETELYRKAAGLGEGGISMATCDERTHEIIKVIG